MQTPIQEAEFVIMSHNLTNPKVGYIIATRSIILIHVHIEVGTTVIRKGGGGNLPQKMEVLVSAIVHLVVTQVLNSTGASVVD